MSALRAHIAQLLLLCLLRTLAPEAWVLALHAHAHTTDEPAHGAGFQRKGKALLSAKHQHCAVEQFYNGAFAAATPVAVPVRPAARRYAPLRAPLAVRQASGRPEAPALLRGPPAGRG